MLTTPARSSVSRITDVSRVRGWSRVDVSPGTVAFAAALSVLVLVGGCAKPGPPGGGPVDSIPPLVVRTEPPEGAVAVGRSVTIEVEFSEEMNRLSVERAVSLVPPVELRNLKWRGKTLLAEPVEQLPESATIVVEIGATARDYHDVAMGAPFALAFSTGATLNDGVIEGTVTTGGDPTPGAVVWACVEPAVPDSSGLLHPCGYTSATADDGTFRMEHVKASATPYALLAFLDADGDKRYSVGAETGGSLEDAAFIEAPGDSAVGIVIPMEPPAARTRPDRQEETE